MLTYTIRPTEDGEVVTFEGEVDESADFSELANLSGKVTFNLEGIERFNSAGIRTWALFVNGLEGLDELILVQCSVPVIAQLNLVRGLKCPVRIESFYVPYVCVETGEEEQYLHFTEEIRDLQNPPMPWCPPGKTLELDDLPERYFSFLKDIDKG
jgi:hypothetical protein